jgi:osmotically-inducible protein OsmY
LRFVSISTRVAQPADSQGHARGNVDALYRAALRTGASGAYPEFALFLVEGAHCRIEVRWDTEETAMVQGIKKSDTQIHRDVLEELKWDSRVDETEVGVEVDDGVVTLTGTVMGWAKRVAAEEAARRVIGVLDVANDVKIKAPGSLTRTDTEIAQAVRSALQWDVFVPDEKITSTVSDGWVTLDGAVERWSERADAERAIRNLTAVKGVVNRIAVKPMKPATDDVRKAIERALERRAEREAKRIRVDVRDGVVTLTGSVHSWAERKSVVGAARFTPGVRDVHDQLRMEAIA